MSVHGFAKPVAAPETSIDAGSVERAPLARPCGRRSCTARGLAEAMTRRGQSTSERKAHMQLVALEGRGIVALADTPGMWVATDYGLKLARGLEDGRS